MMMMKTMVMELTHTDRWERSEYSLLMLLDFQGFSSLLSLKLLKKFLSLHSIKFSNSALASLYWKAMS